MSSKVRNNKRGRLMRIITLPIRLLIKAKDNYVKSMNNLAAPANYGNFMGLHGARSSSVSSSTSSINYDNEDLRDLIRSSSVSALSSLSRNNSSMNNNNMHSSMDTTYMIIKQFQEMKPSSGAVMKNMGSRRVPRSFSVGMSKIDEDKPCDDFVDEGNHLGGTNNISEFMYPRSRSHAVARRNVFI